MTEGLLKDELERMRKETVVVLSGIYLEREIIKVKW
jgi:hypothetical protein